MDKPCFPTTEGLPITSPYGWRFHPIDGEWKFHGAIDIGSGGLDPPIYATQSGVVVVSRFSESGGNMVTIKHTGDPYYSQYMHMRDTPLVNVGDSVTKCQQIGVMGTTGSSTGVHLHFAIATSQGGFGTEEGTIDPEIYLEDSTSGGGGEVDWGDYFVTLRKPFVRRIMI